MKRRIWIITGMISACLLLTFVILWWTNVEESAEVLTVSEITPPKAAIDVNKGPSGITKRVEAEDGELNGVEVISDEHTSAGSFVKGFKKDGDSLKLTTNLEKGTYLINIRYRTYGGDKPNHLTLNNEDIGEYTFTNTIDEWKDAVIGQYDLLKGENTFTISTSWGWIGIDYIEFTGPGGLVNKVNLYTDVTEPQASDIPVTLMATADNAAMYRFLVKPINGEWESLNGYSRRLSHVWLPSEAGDYEIKVQARGLGSTQEVEAEETMTYTVLPAYSNKPLVNPIFSDNMVLQRDEEVAIWGWTEPGTPITVRVDNQVFTGGGNGDGKWIAKIGKHAAGGPYTIKIDNGKSRRTLDNVLFGDVWLCSGQSNMEFTMSDTLNATEEIQNANNTNIRFLTVPSRTSAVPISTMGPSVNWQVVSSDNVGSLTAVGYFFAEQLTKELDVPIGIVFAAVGGTKAESWTSYDTLKDDPDYSQAAEEILSGAVSIDMTSSPIALYNGMIAPITTYQLKGVLWYQGESNWGESSYNKLLPELIADWRTNFNNAELPFILIQIAAFGNLQTDADPVQSSAGLPEIREAQLNASLNDGYVGLVVTSDLGDPGDIHPKNKQDVGLRAARNALGKFYNKDIVYSGPINKSMKIEGNAIQLTFDFVGSGLLAGYKDGLSPVVTSPDNKLKGFAIAGEDKRYYMADAIIEGNSVIVSSTYVSEPISVKYGWSDSPIGNLYNKEGLLASPFRSGE